MEYRILGPLEVSARGEPVALGGPRHRKALAVLLLSANRTVPAERLVRVLWDAEPPSTCREQVQNCVSTLRRTLRAAGLPATAIDTSPAGYRLTAAADELDLVSFERLSASAHRAARDGRLQAAITDLGASLDLWRGPALAGLDSRALEPEVRRLEDQRLAAQEEQARLWIALGQYEPAAGALAVLVAEHPLRESLYALLMTALARSGRKADALAAFHAARRVLRDELGVEPGAALREVERKVLRDELFTGPRVLVSADRPAQLPASAAVFAGRVREIAELDANEAQLTAIVGPAGVGKTALALRWAHRVADRFPDGTLYANLNGFGLTTPERPDVVLERFLRTLGVPAAKIATDCAGRSAQLRTLLSDRRVLVVLDNAADTGQVRELIPGPGQSRVIVTSRRRLDALAIEYDGYCLPLGPLDDQEAQLLVRQLAGRFLAGDPALVGELTRLCDRLPLALRIATARLTSAPRMTLATLLSDLADERHRVHRLASGDGEVAVSAAFDLSYRPLDASVRRLLRLIGLHPGPAPSLGAIAALAGLPPAAVEQPLAELVAASLVDVVGLDRYGLHDLVRLYSRARAEAEEDPVERRLAGFRMLDWYAAGAAAAQSLLWPFEPDSASEHPAATGVRGPDFVAATAAVEWLDAEEPNLVAATTLGPDLDPGRVWRLCFNLRAWLERRVARSTAEHVLRQGIQAADLDGDVRGRARLYIALAVMHSQAGERDRAVEAFRRGAELSSSIGDTRQAVMCQLNIGAMYADTGDPQAAIEVLAEARRLSEELSDPTLVAHADFNAGYAYRQLGRYGSASTYYGRAREYVEATGDLRFLANIRIELAAVARCSGRPAEAVTGYQAALPLARQCGDRLFEAWALHGLGEAYRDLGRPAEATEQLRAALLLYEALQHPDAAEVKALLTA
jgi:DNA-binding SARP family transcriptional activator